MARPVKHKGTEAMHHRHDLSRPAESSVRIGGYRVFFEHFEEHGTVGVCWSPVQESHHSLPGVWWFGPLPDQAAAEADARAEAKAHWRNLYAARRAV